MLEKNVRKYLAVLIDPFHQGLSGELYDDDLPYTILTYGNGDAFYDNIYAYNESFVARRDLTGVDVTSFEFLQAAAAWRGSETHGGEDVAIYARGPMALRTSKLRHTSMQRTFPSSRPK